MQIISLSGTVAGVATTHDSNGASTAADSTPTVTVYRNGSAVAALTDRNMTSIATGVYRYAVALTEAAGFAVGDLVDFIAQATVGGVTARALLWSGRIVAMVDGLTPERALQAMLAATCGEQSFADNQHVSYRQDGSTPDVVRTIGSTPGNITASALQS